MDPKLGLCEAQVMEKAVLHTQIFVNGARKVIQGQFRTAASKF